MTKRTRVKKDITDLELQIEMVENHNDWRKRIHVNNHWN